MPTSLPTSAKTPLRTQHAAEKLTPSKKKRKGAANAARVSIGAIRDRVHETVLVHEPKRHPTERATVTVVLYNTVAGGVPSEGDVRAAIDDMEALYRGCGWHGELADDGASCVKADLLGEVAGAVAEAGLAVG